jgi:Fe-Mn family superoxide dismutase
MWNGKEHVAKELPYKELPGLSQKQLQEHHDILYAGYVKKINEIRVKIDSTDLSSANATYSDIRELKLEETFAANAVKLHEEYFDSLGGDGKISGSIAEMINRDFGSYEKWAQQFKAMGMAARGWVVLAYSWDEKRLMNVLYDAHNQGGITGYAPMMVLDVYEHAYFIDYATARKKYIDAFFTNINWNNANKLIEEKRIKI